MSQYTAQLMQCVLILRVHGVDVFIQGCLISSFFNSREAIAAIIGNTVVFTTRRGVLRFYRFFLAESKFVHDLNFDFCSSIYLRF